MLRRHSKKHLLWLLPLVLLLLLAMSLAVLLGVLRSQGLHWQGVTWQGGPRLSRIWWQEGNCRRFQAADVHLRLAWPLQLQVARMRWPACPSTEQGPPSIVVPQAPPFDMSIQALQYQDYPPLAVSVHQRAGHWWVRARHQDSHLRVDYFATDSGRWQLTGHVQAAQLDSRLGGELVLQGSGHWRPAGERTSAYFAGRLDLQGQQLGGPWLDARAELSLALAWQGRDWTLHAALAQPLALAPGWTVSPGQGLQARGQGLHLQQADVQMAINAAQAEAVLAMHSQDERLGRGQGELTFNDGVSGKVAFRWANGRLHIRPFKLQSAWGPALVLNRQASLPLAARGEVAPALTLRYDDVAITTAQSRFSWQPGDWQWRGQLSLGGHWQGYELGGGWTGVIDANGVHGAPVAIRLDGTDGQLQARLPVNDITAFDGPFTAQLAGHYQGINAVGMDINASVTAAARAAGWGGSIQAHGHLPQLDSGGQLALTGDWHWRDGLQLAAGARLDMAEALYDEVLLRPLRLVASTPIRVDDTGVHGQFQLAADGLVATRWVLPAVTGELAFDGWTFELSANIPQWGSRLTVAGQDVLDAPNGAFSVHTMLFPAMSRGLGGTLREGEFNATGHWQAGAKSSVSAHMRINDAAVDWGGITAHAVQADLNADWRAGAAYIRSRTPVTLGRLEVGIPISDIRFALETDLQTWVAHDVTAALLGGRLTAQRLSWPSTSYEAITLSGIDTAQIAKLQSKPVVQLSGEIGGTIPLRLQRDTLAIQDGQLHNETPMKLTLSETAGERALAQSHAAVGLALDALNPLHINDFEARIDMQGDGWLQADMTLKGRNPNYRRPLVLNYTHQENMYKLLRSLRISGRIVDAVVDKTAAATGSSAN